MKCFIVLLAVSSCCFAATIKTIPVVPFNDSLPHFDVDAFPSDANSRIVFGVAASTNQFPHQVHIRISADSGTTVCGGSILSARWVLSAAHCTIGANQFTLRFGSINANSGGIVQTVFPAAVTNHPQYNPQNLNNDLALMSLPSSLSFSAAVRAVRLPTRGQASTTFAEQMVTVSGWGAVENGGPPETMLRYANVVVVTNSRCSQTFGNSAVNANVICTMGYNNGRQGVCGGDSGGPLIIAEGNEITQIGVVSFNAGRNVGGCTGNRPSGYARTSGFVQWINQHSGIPIRG